MAGDPKYQYPYRWEEVGPLLFPEPSPTQSRALSLLEQKDRDAEDHWGGAGGTAQSLLLTQEGGFSVAIDPVDANFGSSHDSTTTIAIPSDVAFHYYVNWNIGGSLQFADYHGNIPSTTAPVYIQSQGFAGFDDFPNGAGYEGFGWKVADFVMAPGYYVYAGLILGGHGQRFQQIPDASRGTTCTLRFTAKVLSNFGVGVSGGINWNLQLFAIPT